MSTAPDTGTEILVLMQPPVGDPCLLPLAQVLEGQRRAQELGLASGAAAISAPATPPLAERWLTSQELAALLGVGDTTLESMAKDGRIPSLRVGKALRFRASEVEAALRPRDSESPAHPHPHVSTRHLNGRNHKATARP